MAVLWAHSFPLAFTTKVKILPFQNFRYKFPALRELYSSTSRALHYSSASKRFQKVLSLLWYHKQCKGRHDCVSPAFTESPVSSEHHIPHISCCQTRKNKFLLLDQRHHGQWELMELVLIIHLLSFQAIFVAITEDVLCSHSWLC